MLAEISAAATGELGWPSLTLFRALLLATRHNLSNVRLTEVLNDRTSFRRFCGFGSHKPTPKRTAFMRFRRTLVRLDLDRMLFEAVTRQLDTSGLVIRSGTLVDATLLPSASIQHDIEAKWVDHRRRKPVHDYKAHIATNQEAALIRKVQVTTAIAHDAARLEAVLPTKLGDVYSDSGFASARSDRLILACGGMPLNVQTVIWGGRTRWFG